MNFAYDLDGVLADTREAVELSYRQAGANPPPWFWGRPWREWLDDEKIHQKKNQLFQQNSHLIKPLPLLEVFKKTNGVILTGASYTGAMITMTQIGIPDAIVIFGLTAQEKVDEMNSFIGTGIMFEDSANNVEIMREKTKWQIIHVNQF